MDVKNILTGLFDRLSGLRAERPTAGTKFRLMGMVADIAEVAQTLQQEVLLRVSQEAALDVDVDVDFADLAEQVMSMELMPANAGLQEQTEQVNDALGALSAVLAQIDDQLSRRHKDEENAKAHRSAFMKYMHKIELAQQERHRLQADADTVDESNLLPDVLATGIAMKYWQRLQQAGFVDKHYQLLPDTTRKQAMYIADTFSDKLQMRSKWKPFQDLWHINNLAQEKWEMQETGKVPYRSEEIDKIFGD